MGKSRRRVSTHRTRTRTRNHKKKHLRKKNKSRRGNYTKKMKVMAGGAPLTQYEWNQLTLEQKQDRIDSTDDINELNKYFSYEEQSDNTDKTISEYITQRIKNILSQYSRKQKLPLEDNSTRELRELSSSPGPIPGQKPDTGILVSPRRNLDIDQTPPPPARPPLPLSGPPPPATSTGSPPPPPELPGSLHDDDDTKSSASSITIHDIPVGTIEQKMNSRKVICECNPTSKRTSGSIPKPRPQVSKKTQRKLNLFFQNKSGTIDDI